MAQTWFCNLRPTKVEGTILLDPQISGVARCSGDVAGMIEHSAAVPRLVSDRGLPVTERRSPADVTIPREVRMPAHPYRWSDVEGTPVHLLCRVEQIAVDPQNGALPARLHQQGQVIGWDTTWLHVCMDHDRALVILRAYLVRVLDWPRGS
ncbi:MAG: hypothetical protein JO115_25180 [Pseudonocardiales bacterium]|nr:hypothetical protein [Pseudonocardiales bacterium]